MVRLLEKPGRFKKQMIVVYGGEKSPLIKGEVYEGAKEISKGIKIRAVFCKKERDNNIIVFAGCSYVPFGSIFIECNTTFEGHTKKSTKSKTLFGVA